MGISINSGAIPILFVGVLNGISLVLSYCIYLTYCLILIFSVLPNLVL